MLGNVKNDTNDTRSSLIIAHIAARNKVLGLSLYFNLYLGQFDKTMNNKLKQFHLERNVLYPGQYLALSSILYNLICFHQLNES